MDRRKSYVANPDVCNEGEHLSLDQQAIIRTSSSFGLFIFQPVCIDDEDSKIVGRNFN